MTLTLNTICTAVYRLLLVLIVLILIPEITSAQSKAIVYGKVTDAGNHALPLVNVSVFGNTTGAVTDNKGNYKLEIPADKDITLVFSFIGYHSIREKLKLIAGEKREINRILIAKTTELGILEVKDDKINRGTNLVKINPKTATLIPSASGAGIETLVKTLSGVYSNNELSSQYSVRGGNYDENLVYVNDIEIYRPFLVRSGQQEGLSFLNPDMVSSILFSAGGFDAKYGDKMSSVLDIQYKRPQEVSGSVTLSLLGASAHFEGSAIKSKKDSNGRKRLGYLLGIRQKSNQYVLNSLQTKGEYRPSFTDVQTYITYELSKKSELAFLGNYAKNVFKMVPQDRETAFGTITEAYQFKVYFEGQEQDKFDNYLGALTYSFRPNVKTSFKLIGSAFRTREQETFDILGQYYLSRLETDWSSDKFGRPTEPIGVGSYLNHARNYLDARVYNLEQRGSYDYEGKFLSWGAKYQHEIINDRMSEWTLIDSAGYSLPHLHDSVGFVIPAIQPTYTLELQDVVKSKNTLESNRYSAFVQNTWNLNTDSTKLSLTAGIRGQLWDVNKQLLIAPRVSVSYKPKWKKDVLFRLATGIYHQPPFYRELRDSKGNLNKDLKAQTSYQIVAGSDWNFSSWKRPFKFVSEVYYKYLENLVPYEVDNVRIRYDARNNSNGYAVGVDLRVNGEFVKGTESWASMSVMQTKEDIKDDFYVNSSGDTVHPGFLPRPTDQRVIFNLFFQDFLPHNPTFKMYLNVIFGSSLHFGPPDSPKYLHTYKMPPYKRVDIGFSKMIKGDEAKVSEKSLLRHFKQVWVSLEIFNLLQISNTISYFWVSDISNKQYAIPNYLTPRQLNLKLYAQF